MSTVTVLASPERRRRWTPAEKQRIVEESLTADTTVAEVARRHDIHPNLLHLWRRQVRQGCLGGEAIPALVPVEITSTPALAGGPQLPVSSPLPAQRARAGIIEIELSGCRVRVDRDVDAEALQRVLDLLRRR
jgi:transposase